MKNRMNIIIPMGGSSKKTSDTEYMKGLQEIERKTIMQYVFESLQEVETDRFIVVVKREDASRFHVDNIVHLLHPGAEVVVAEGETMGAVCTCMLAVDLVKMDEPLLITGSDQILTVSPKAVIEDFEQKGYDAGVVVFDDVHPRWSYVRLDENGYVVEAAEKRPISHNATAGFFYFKKAFDFFEMAKRMIFKNASVNGQFFVCPVLNEMILNQQKIGAYHIDKSEYYNFNSMSGVDAYKKYLQSTKGK